MHDKEALGTVILFSCMCLSSWLAFTLSGSASLPKLIFSTATAFTASILVFLFSKALARKESSSSYKKKFIMALYAILDGSSSGISKASSLSGIANSSNDPAFRKAVISLRKRILMGSTGFLSESAPELHSILGDTEIPDSLEQLHVRAFIEESETRLTEKASAIESHSQRFATANMFMSTVLPSFIIFAFIGSSIISAARPSMLFFSSSLLFVLPVLYAAGNSKLNGGLIG